MAIKINMDNQQNVQVNSSKFLDVLSPELEGSITSQRFPQNILEHWYNEPISLFNATKCITELILLLCLPIGILVLLQPCLDIQLFIPVKGFFCPSTESCAIDCCW